MSKNNYKPCLPLRETLNNAIHYSHFSLVIVLYNRNCMTRIVFLKIKTRQYFITLKDFKTILHIIRHRTYKAPVINIEFFAPCIMQYNYNSFRGRIVNLILEFKCPERSSFSLTVLFNCFSSIVKEYLQKLISYYCL